MKLLTKQEIQGLKARERLQEIQEGKKLASTVDALRQVRADEEKALERFRVETLSTIHTQVSEEEKKLALLKSEVSIAEDRRAKALIPLTEEAKRIEEEKESLGKLSEEVSEREVSLKKKEKAYDELSRELEQEKKRIESERTRSIQSLEEAEQKKKEAHNTLLNAKKIESEAEKEKEVVMKDLQERSQAILNRENENKLREDRMTRREIEQNRREIALNDKYNTFIRTEERTYGKRTTRRK